MISRFLQRYFNLSNIQKKRLTLNLTSQSVNLFIRIIAQFLFPPLMIFVWGLENFGIWIFLLSLPNLLNIVNFNFIESSKQDMVYFYNQENSEKVKTIFQCSYFLTLFTIAFFLIISLIFYFSSDFNFKATVNLSLDVFKMSFIIIVATICLNILDGIFISVVSIKGKAYLIDYNRIIFDTILKISLIVSGLFFNNFFVMVLVFFALKIIQTISFYFFYTRHKEYLEISFNKLSKKELYRQLKLSVSYNIEIITEIINNNGLIFVLGIFFNASIIALVSTCKTLFYFFPKQIFATVNHASLFEYTSLFAKKEIGNVKYIFKKHIKLVLIAAILFVFFSLTLGPSVYNLWLGSRLSLNYNLIYLIILIVFFEIIYWTIIIPQRSINQFFKLSFFKFIVSGITLLISFFLYYLSFQLLVYFYIFLICNFFLIIYSIFQVNKFFTSTISND